MSDNTNSETDDTDETEESTTEIQPLNVVSTYKVRGKFTDQSGAGVLGYNEATTGDSIGVQGVTDSSSGYGLHTPDDARVEGIAEVTGIGGSLTGGNDITDLAGEGIALENGSVSVNSIYKTETFTSEETTWTPVSGLSSETPVEVTIDAAKLEQGAGFILVEVDGSIQRSYSGNTVGESRIFGPSSSLTIRSDFGFVFDTDFTVSQDSSPRGVAFGDSGNKLYIAGDSNDNVYEYDLGSPWDLSSVTYTTKSLDVSGEDSSPWGITFKDDGSKLFLAGQSDEINSYTLSTDWDIGTASYKRTFTPSVSIDLTDVAFKSDGSKMYLAGNSSVKVFEYELSTNWRIDSATKTNEFDLSFISDIGGIAFTDDGKELYAHEDSGNFVQRYDLATAWDLSTLARTSDTVTFDQTENVKNVAIRDDGTRLFALGSGGNSNGSLYQYNGQFNGTAYVSAQWDRR